MHRLTHFFVPPLLLSRPTRIATGHYAISAVRPKGTIVSMLILPSYAGPESIAPGRTQYRLGTHSRDLFNTVPKLLMYYTGGSYPQPNPSPAC